MSHRTVAVTGAILTVLALPAAASAAQLDQQLRPCYATTVDGAGNQISEPVDIVASGFTPNSPVDIAVNGVSVGEPILTDGNGAIGTLSSTQIPAPFVASGESDFTLTMTDQANPANVVSATAKSTSLGVSVKPQQAKPSSEVRWRGRGFTLDRPIYAHYVYKGKARKTVRMTRSPGICGTFSKKSPQIPVASPGLGKWTVQFDQRKKYRKNPGTTFVRLTIQIFRKFD